MNKKKCVQKNEGQETKERLLTQTHDESFKGCWTVQY